MCAAASSPLPPITVIYNPAAGGGYAEPEPAWLAEVQRALFAATGAKPQLIPASDFAFAANAA